MLSLAAALVLSLPQPALRQEAPRLIEFTRPRAPEQAPIAALAADGFPEPLRSPCWRVTASYGLGAVFASIGGVVADVTQNQSATRNPRTNALGMLIGLLVGGVPGVLLGEQARQEANGIARGVSTLLAIGGTAGLAFTTTRLFKPF